MNIWSAENKGIEVILSDGNTIATCNKGSGMGMSGVLGKLGLESIMQFQCQLLKVSSNMAIGVAEASTSVERYDDDAKKTVIRSTGEICAYGKTIFTSRHTQIREGDHIQIEFNSTTCNVAFYVNGDELFNLGIESAKSLRPYFSGCLGASIVISDVSLHS